MWDDARQMNIAAGVLVALAALAVLWSFGGWLVRQPWAAFREVVVAAPLERASAPHVEAVIRDELAGTFFTMDLARAGEALKKVAWVRNVSLRRQWPGRLEVTVEEHVPLARWNDAALVNTDGETFVADWNGELPLFAGPEGRAAEVTLRWREWTEVLAPLALTLPAIRLSERGGWSLSAAGAAGRLQLELGRDEPSTRLGRFVAAYGRTIGALARVGTKVGHVDLRYRNGFAARVPGFREKPPKKAA
jgi:cell division protein FtsQ